MKNWLDKYEYGGQAGYTDVPFDYNSAWGGQFEEGGEIPQAQRGSVRCPNNLCNDMRPRIDIGSLLNNIGERFGFAANTIGQGVGNLFHNKSRKKKLPNNTDYSNNNYYTSTGNPFSSGPGYNNDFKFTGAEYIPQNDFPTYMSDFDFSNFAIPGSVISQPNYMQRSTPIYDDAIVSRYMSPEANTAEGIRSGGSQGIPILPTAAMGGSIPGTVGFTYARTQGAAPSNGPYAKKTKASAQDGTKLTKAEEEKYQIWRSKLPKPLQWEGDYDLKGLWKSNPSVKPSPNLHFPDTYKLPNHPTFSNESKYYDSFTPGVGGYWGEGEENFIKNPQIGPPVPHAENGMTYYQHGLDWKPKTISKNGSDIPKNQNAEFVLPRFDMPRAASESTSRVFLDPITGKQKSTATVGQKSRDVKASTEAMGKGNRTEEREKQTRINERKSAKAFNEGKSKTFTFPTGETKTLDQMDWRDKAYITGKSLEGKGRFNENDETFVDEWLNPLNWITETAGALGTAPYEARESDSNLPYVGAVGNALFQGALGLDPLGSAIKFAKSPVTKSVAKTLVDIPRAESIKEAIGRVGGIPLKKDLPRMGAQDVKALRQVQEIGRLRATNSPYAEQMRYGLENNLPEEHFQKVFGRSREEAQHLLDTGFGEQEAARSAGIRSRINLQRPSNRFEPTDMTPEEIAISNRGVDLDIDVAGEPFNINWNTATDSDITEAARRWGMSEDQVRSIGERSAIRSDRVQDIVDRFSQPRSEYTELSPEAHERLQRAFNNIIIPGQERPRIPLSMQLRQDVTSGVNKLIDRLGVFVGNMTQNYPFYSGEVLEKVPSLHLSSQGGLKNVSKKVNFAPEGIQSGDIFTGSTNTSHSSYLPQLKQVFKYTKGDPQFLGYRPMNSLGFLSNYGYKGGDIAKYLNSEIDEQIKRGILPKDISRPFLKNESVMLPHYGVKQHRKGGVIEDDRGQWAHPGKITKINSNQITMKGVDYPVLGISDTGDKKMMYPEQEYTFKGKTVTEYPQKKKTGGWLEKYN